MRTGHFFFGFGAGVVPPPPNGFGGTETPRRAEGAALDCALGFGVFAGDAATIGAGAGSGSGAGATTNGGGSGAGVEAAVAAFAFALIDGAAPDALVLAFVCGSSEVPRTTSAAVPTTTQTPTSTRQTRAPRLMPGRNRGVTAPKSENATCDGAERMLAAASPE